MSTPITTVLVRMTFRPVAAIAAWFSSIGLQADLRDHGTAILRNPRLNLNVLLSDDSDPLSRARALAYVLVGELWVLAYPDLLPAVEQEWQRRSRRADNGDPSFRDLYRDQPGKE